MAIFGKYTRLIFLIFVIFFGAVFWKLAFFLSYLQLKEDADSNISEEVKVEKARITPVEYKKVEIKFEKLTYSVPMPSGMPMTLAMDITLVMQPTSDEINNNIELTPQDWETFKKTVEKMKPWIKDQLTRRIKKMSSSELNTDRGQNQIMEFIKEKVNYELERMYLKLSKDNINKKRIADVYITNYYFN